MEVILTLHVTLSLTPALTLKGIFVGDGSNIKMAATSFEDNAASSTGGGVLVYEAHYCCVNCTFTRNNDMELIIALNLI